MERGRSRRTIVLGNDERRGSCSDCGEGSESSSDVDGVRGRVLNPEQGPESDDEMDDVEEVQGRSEEGLEMGGCRNLKETSMSS